MKFRCILFSSFTKTPRFIFERELGSSEERRLTDKQAASLERLDNGGPLKNQATDVSPRKENPGDLSNDFVKKEEALAEDALHGLGLLEDLMETTKTDKKAAFEALFNQNGRDKRIKELEAKINEINLSMKGKSKETRKNRIEIVDQLKTEVSVLKRYSELESDLESLSQIYQRIYTDSSLSTTEKQKNARSDALRVLRQETMVEQDELDKWLKGRYNV